MLTRLHEAVAAVAPIDGVCGRPGAAAVTIQFRPEATAGERAAARAVADAFDWTADGLADAKAAAIAAVEARTAALLADPGFGYGGRQFPCDKPAMGLWAGMLALASAGVLTYPTGVEALDHSAVMLADATAVFMFCGAGAQRVQQVMGLGTLLKQQIDAATDVAAVAAVTDDRT